MTRVPRLSLGLPVYNGEKYLAESLDALLGQSYQDFELIISDNASTDGTAEICREYGQRDSRIRYYRQSVNIGAAPNHNFVLGKARGEMFSWVAADDLYGRELLQRCVESLDAHPEVILAAAWTAAVDETGQLTQAQPYPLDTESRSAPERFRSMLHGTAVQEGSISADDDYGVIRVSVLRQISPLNSFHHSDKALMIELALHGPFHHEPQWLYFRRDHADRALRANPTVRTWCSNLDPRRASALRHPVARLYGEYMWSFISAIQRAPLSPADRRECYRELGRWAAGRAGRKLGSLLGGHRATTPWTPARPDLPDIPVGAMVAGQEARPR